jgi:DUF1680 family protein
MTITQRINRIQALLKTADVQLLAKIELLLEKEGEVQEDNSVLTEAQKRELDERREQHLKGESKSYSWQEIKQELIDEHGLQT